MDRLDEDILRAVDRFLDQNAKVGDDDQALLPAVRIVLWRFAIFRVIAFLAFVIILRRRCRKGAILFGRVVRAHGEQKDAASLVAVILQVIGEADRLVVRPSAFESGQWHVALEALAEIVRAEAVVVETRVGEVAAGL